MAQVALLNVSFDRCEEAIGTAGLPHKGRTITYLIRDKLHTPRCQGIS